jgi:membrane associated rhomboid family serine protease
LDAEPQPEREPFLRAPWPVVALLAVILGAFPVQAWFGVEPIALAWGFSPAGLAHGRWAPLILDLFLHGGWLHVLANSAFILAFGTPVARRFGTDAKGATTFLAFFLMSGVLANLGYAAVNPGSTEPMVGASGAASGLMAAASRLMTREPRLAPFLSRPVISMAIAWIVVNLILAVAQTFGGPGLAPGSNGAPVAWEAHLAGYLAGLVLFEPSLVLVGRVRPPAPPET